MNKGYVYIMTNKNKTTLYVGVTSDLMKRIAEHKTKVHPASFTAKYNCSMLVFYQEFDSIVAAIAEEKRLKGGNRQQKIDLINSLNPNWVDIAQDWYN